MKKLTIITLLTAAFIAVSCTKTEEVQVIKEVQVVVDKNPLPDSLAAFFADTAKVRQYNALIADFKTGNYGTVPDFVVVSYGKNNNALNGQQNTGLKRNHISFQFFKNNTRYFFVTKPIKDFQSQGDEYVSGVMSTGGITFNPDFYNSNQFVYKVINY